jgi:hypothetical protein
MTTSQEMDAQFGDSEIERRLKDLERKIEAYEQGGFDLFRQFGYVQLGLNLPRLDKNGIQIQTPTPATGDVPGIYWVNQLSVDPDSEEPRVELAGRADPDTTSFPNGLFSFKLRGKNAERFGMFSHTIGASGTNQVGMSIWNRTAAPAGAEPGFTISDSGTAIQFTLFGGDRVKITTMPLWLGQFTADPASLQDGAIWYRTDTDFFYGERNGSAVKFLMEGDASGQAVALSFIIDGGGSTITTGQKGHLEVPFGMTITGWTILGDASGSIVVDVWKDTYANFPPTVADTIAGSEKPTLSTAQKNQDLSLSTWTTSVTAGDILAFNVDSATTVQRVLVSIRGTRT